MNDQTIYEPFTFVNASFGRLQFVGIALSYEAALEYLHYRGLHTELASHDTVPVVDVETGHLYWLDPTHTSQEPGWGSRTVLIGSHGPLPNNPDRKGRGKFIRRYN